MNYRILRLVFIIAHIVGFITFFLPRSGDLSSEFETTRYLLTEGDSARGLFFLATFAARIALPILAMLYPRRWVFVTGGSWAALVIAYDLFVGWDGVGFLGTCQLLARLVGFIVVPPALGVVAATQAATIQPAPQPLSPPGAPSAPVVGTGDPVRDAVRTGIEAAFRERSRKDQP